jgi:hypothetical protein
MMDSAIVAHERRDYTARAIFILAAAAFVMATTEFVIVQLLPTLARDFDLSISVVDNSRRRHLCQAPTGYWQSPWESGGVSDTAPYPICQVPVMKAAPQATALAGTAN